MCGDRKARACLEPRRGTGTDLFSDRRAVLTDIRHDKYVGRKVARVRNAEGGDFSEALLASGHACAYGDCGSCLAI